MRTVGIKLLKDKLSEYIRLAGSGETILITPAGNARVATLRDMQKGL